MGGRIDGNPIERWARDGDGWVLVVREAETRQRFALAALDGLLVAFGCEDAMEDVSSFDPDTNTWRAGSGDD